MIFVFWMLSFKPTFSLSTFTFIKRLFSSFSLSALRVVSSAYLRLLLFLAAILIPAWVASSLVFHMIYSAYQSWIVTGRTDAEAETPILWPPDAKSWLFGKDPDAGKDWRQEKKGITENEMVGWHHWFSGHEFEQISGAWCAAVHGVAKSQTQLSNRTMNNNNRKQLMEENKEQREDFYFIEFIYRLGWKNQ